MGRGFGARVVLNVRRLTNLAARSKFFFDKALFPTKSVPAKRLCSQDTGLGRCDSRERFLV